jgi:hypothetical protein
VKGIGAQAGFAITKRFLPWEVTSGSVVLLTQPAPFTPSRKQAGILKTDKVSWPFGTSKLRKPALKPPTTV